MYNGQETAPGKICQRTVKIVQRNALFPRFLDLLHRLADLAVLFELDAVAFGEGADHIDDIGLDLQEVRHYLVVVVTLEVLCGFAL